MYIDRDYDEKMSLRDKMSQVCSNPNAATFAYDQLALHFAAANKQMQRIWKIIALAKRSMPPERTLSNADAVERYFEAGKNIYGEVFIEIHFYFIAWTNCGKMMKVLGAQPEFSEASRYFNSVRRHFDSFDEARNSFEHFHDFLPGAKSRKKRQVKEVQEPNAGSRKIYRGLSPKNGKYIFSNKSWDITPSSLSLLESLVNDFLEIIHRVVDQV